jgi:hypothetical protein
MTRSIARFEREAEGFEEAARGRRLGSWVVGDRCRQRLSIFRLTFLPKTHGSELMAGAKATGTMAA